MLPDRRVDERLSENPRRPFPQGGRNEGAHVQSAHWLQGSAKSADEGYASHHPTAGREDKGARRGAGEGEEDAGGEGVRVDERKVIGRERIAEECSLAVSLAVSLGSIDSLIPSFYYPLSIILYLLSSILL